jgi:hypothetical protein
MRATPIQISLCVTCALLLLAKLREWWQALATPKVAPALSLMGEVAPRRVVPQATPPPVTDLFATEPDADPEPVPVEVAVAVQPPPPPLLAELKAQAERELTAARLRAQSMAVNADAQARQILEDAERDVTEIAARAVPAAVEAPQEQQAARRQGEREGHAIGLRKGEMEALGRIERVFERIEGVLMETGLPC